jgi:hypothetical protein
MGSRKRGKPSKPEPSYHGSALKSLRERHELTREHLGARMSNHPHSPSAPDTLVNTITFFEETWVEDTTADPHYHRIDIFNEVAGASLPKTPRATTWLDMAFGADELYRYGLDCDFWWRT